VTFDEGERLKVMMQPEETTKKSLREKGTIGDKRERLINSYARARKGDLSYTETVSVLQENEDEMGTISVTVRLSEELMDEITALMKHDGLNQTQTITTLLERGLSRAPEIEKNKEMPGWYQRAHERDYFLRRIEIRREQVRAQREQDKKAAG